MSIVSDHNDFNRCFAHLGGQAKDFSYLGTVGEEIPQLVDFYNSVLKQASEHGPEFPFIQLGIVNNMSINAHAVSYGEKYFIGITLGLILFTSDLFSTIMSDRCFAQGIGDIDAEKNKCIDLSKLVSVYRDLAENSPRTDGPWQIFQNIPRDPIRKSYAHHCIEFALDFTVGHEIAHITRRGA